jgi:peptide/nickel transport system substrate-binding protein
VRQVQVVDPLRVRFSLKQPWPDFLVFYATPATGAAWIVPRKYVEKVGDEGFKKHPIGAGPYKFVSFTPGVELVLDANEGYWRKVPSVKRLQIKVIADETTRLAMLKRGEVDIAYLLDVPQAQEVKRDPNLRLAFSGGIAIWYLDFLEQWDPKSPWSDRRVRLAANYAIDRQALSEAETLGASKPAGNHVPRSFEFALPIEPYPYDPAKARQLLAEAGYPKGFDAGELHQLPPYFSLGEAIVSYFQAVGIRLKMRPMERGAYFALITSKKAKGVCVCTSSLYGNAASRMSEVIPSDGAYAYGGYPDIDALFREQAVETDRKKREAQLHQIQRLVYERVRYGPIFEYMWPSGIGPRVAEPALMLINPYPWSAPLEEVRLKRP